MLAWGEGEFAAFRALAWDVGAWVVLVGGWAGGVWRGRGRARLGWVGWEGERQEGRAGRRGGK
eukprot:7262367-Alexandrium_andersonii.AAC.1